METAPDYHRFWRLTAEALNFPKGESVEFDHGLGQTIARTFEAYHRFKTTQYATFATGTAAWISLAFGPVGWVLAGSLATIAGTMGVKQNNANGYRTMPLAEQVETLAKAGFRLVSNDGISICLRRE